MAFLGAFFAFPLARSPNRWSNPSKPILTEAGIGTGRAKTSVGL
jgi:hypothetical protein